MPKELHDVKIAILTCPFEPPKPKTKHKVDIDTVEKFESLRAQEQQYFTDMVKVGCMLRGDGRGDIVVLGVGCARRKFRVAARAGAAVFHGHGQGACANCGGWCA